MAVGGGVVGKKGNLFDMKMERETRIDNELTAWI
jgi:hypothetical protein